MIAKLKCTYAQECRDAGIDCGKECWRHPCYGKDCTMCEEQDICPIKKTGVEK